MIRDGIFCGRRARFLLQLGVLFLWGCASRQNPSTADAPLLVDLKLIGVQNVSENLIREKIVTTQTSWIPFSEQHYFDELVFETDLKRIVRLYQSQGYYEARIVSRKVTPIENDKVNVVVEIDEGLATSVGERNISGLERLPSEERDRLIKDLPLEPGDIFLEQEYEALKQIIVARLVNSGYAQAWLKGAVTVRKAENKARLDLEVIPGIQYRFGRIFVAGANQVPRNKIVQEAQAFVPEGRIFSRTALEEAQQKIFGLGVFSTVKVNHAAPDPVRRTVPIVAQVREAPFRTLRLGGGVGYNSQRTELPRVKAEWTNRNFFGGLRKLSFSNELALVFVPNLWKSEEKGLAVNSTLEFTQPEIIGNDVDLTTTLGYERDVSTTFRYFNAFNGSMGIVYSNDSRFSLSFSYNISLFESKVNSSGTSTEIAERQSAALDSCAKDGSYCLLTYLEQKVQYDLRDNPADPKKGWYTSLSIQEGSHLLGGRFDYLRFLPELRAYWPMGRHVIAARGMAGFLIPREKQTSSVLTRFFLGSSTHRGFGSRALSPVLESDHDTPIGGEGMLEGSLELRFVLPAGIGIVPFFDVGQVASRLSELVSKNNHYAAGLGIRYRTPFGPIRFDVARRLNNPPVGGVGLPWHPWEPHFSIGEAF